MKNVKPTNVKNVLSIIVHVMGGWKNLETNHFSSGIVLKTNEKDIAAGLMSILCSKHP